MNQRQLLSSALASLLAAASVSMAQAHDMDAPKGKEKCFGIVKAGQNSCANLSGTHSCAGEAQTDNSPVEWKLVAKGTCAKLGGLTIEQAKAALAKAGSK
ncbi:BufA1 family periplasmic bufferin-type metallophore [Aquabacterium sp.]|uniref:BufA1 family periplasmic bufferin-type metallophore n=1 Tax=Aquabacterium sp. TaxID=1872578 RepID=UPI0040383D5F